MEDRENREERLRERIADRLRSINLVFEGSRLKRGEGPTGYDKTGKPIEAPKPGQKKGDKVDTTV